MVEPLWKEHAGYRLVAFAEQTEITAQDVIDLWLRETGLTEEQAQRRAPEVLYIAIAPDGTLAAVTTAYLQLNEQLQAHVWHLRAFSATAHREAYLGESLAKVATDAMEARFVSGDDRRGIGLLMEVENTFLKQVFNHARWQPLEYLYINDNANGDHVRIRYFTGAPAPQPTVNATSST